jgi:hypothetical protein
MFTNCGNKCSHFSLGISRRLGAITASWVTNSKDDSLGEGAKHLDPAGLSSFVQGLFAKGAKTFAQACLPLHMNLFSSFSHFRASVLTPLIKLKNVFREAKVVEHERSVCRSSIQWEPHSRSCEIYQPRRPFKAEITVRVPFLSLSRFWPVLTCIFCAYQHCPPGIPARSVHS